MSHSCNLFLIWQEREALARFGVQLAAASGMATPGVEIKGTDDCVPGDTEDSVPEGKVPSTHTRDESVPGTSSPLTNAAAMSPRTSLRKFFIDDSETQAPDDDVYMYGKVLAKATQEVGEAASSDLEKSVSDMNLNIAEEDAANEDIYPHDQKGILNEIYEPCEEVVAPRAGSWFDPPHTSTQFDGEIREQASLLFHSQPPKTEPDVVSMDTAAASGSGARPKVKKVTEKARAPRMYKDDDTPTPSGSDSGHKPCVGTARKPFVRPRPDEMPELHTQRLDSFVTHADEDGKIGDVPRYNFVASTRRVLEDGGRQVLTQFRPDCNEHHRNLRAREVAWVAENGPRPQPKKKEAKTKRKPSKQAKKADDKKRKYRK